MLCTHISIIDTLRWRHIIRNFTIRNRDSRRLVFLNFLLRVKDLVNSDCRFGFLVKNCIYSQLEMSRILNSEPKIRNFQTLVPKNAISYRMSPPYFKKCSGHIPGMVREQSQKFWKLCIFGSELRILDISSWLYIQFCMQNPNLRSKWTESSVQGPKFRKT